MIEGFTEFKRLLHFGPCISIGIIKCITFMTLYMNSMWWPSNLSFYGFVNQTIFLILSALTAFNFVMASINGPKYLPFGWMPLDDKAKMYLQFCDVCKGFKAPRSHHCRKCDRCVKKMDHHCPWINNCVGHGNHWYFTCFLGFAVIGCLHATIILCCSLYRGIHRQWYLYYGKTSFATVHLGLWSLIFCIFSLGLAIGVVFAVGMLLFFQLRAIFRNRTGIEEWIIEKARYRRDTNDLFIYPYDLGCKKNIEQVANWSCAPIGDGISWEIREGCDQFTLTREQISQKAEKRARTKLYMIIRKSTGSWLPILSQGIKVTIHPPCTDEPRIKLNENDIVRVTRWRKYWLFGEKIIDDEKLKDSRRIRGWFPRICATEIIENYDDDEQQEYYNYNHNHNNIQKLNDERQEPKEIIKVKKKNSNKKKNI